MPSRRSTTLASLAGLGSLAATVAATRRRQRSLSAPTGESAALTEAAAGTDSGAAPPPLAVVRDRARDVQEQASTFLAEQGRVARLLGRNAGRQVVAPFNQSLDLARDRLLTGLPEAADTKWRVKTVLVRALVHANVRHGAAHAGNMLHDSGMTYASTAAGSAPKTSRVLHETILRLSRACDFQGGVHRRDGVVDFITVECPFIDTAEDEDLAAICEAVCGDRASLFEGIAVEFGASYEAPMRMGAGDTHCHRIYRMPSADTAEHNGQ